MAIFIGLLRAVNLGRTSTLAMKELTSMCNGLGFKGVRTYINSGNVVFESALAEDKVRDRLEQALIKKMNKKVDVIVRSPSELRSILKANPFPHAEPAKVIVVFLAQRLPKGLLDDFAAPGGEEVRLGRREIYIHYPNGMGRSKLKLPSLGSPSTARNINTVTRLLAITEA